MKRLFLIFVIILSMSLIFVGCDDGEEAVELDPEREVPTITFHTTTADYDQVRYEAALMVAEWWGELGLDVDVRPLEFSALMDTVRNRPPEDKGWEAYMYGWGGRPERIDPDTFIYSLFHSSQAMEGGSNIRAYISEEFDEVAEAMRTTMDLDERRELAFRAQEILAEDVPSIILYFPEEIQGYNNERWTDIQMVDGIGLYQEWTVFSARPLTDDAQLRVAHTRTLDTFNVFAANMLEEWNLMRYAYDFLVRVNPQHEPEPWAAESIDIVDDVTVDVVLQDGMLFQDGEPVTPEDVVFTFEYMMEWGVPFLDAFISPIESVELLEDDTIRFNLEEPYGPFISNTLSLVPILPKHVWENVVDEHNLDHPSQFVDEENIIIGSGPLKFDRWERGQYVRLDKFEDYHLADEVEVDGLMYMVYGHSEGVFGALETGEADLNVWRFEPEHVEHAMELDHLTVETTETMAFRILGFNCYEGPFSDVNLRRAAAHAVNMDQIVDVLVYGYGAVGGAGQALFPGNEFWKNPDVREYPFDIEAGRAILEEAGYEWDSEGRLYYPEG